MKIVEEIKGYPRFHMAEKECAHFYYDSKNYFEALMEEGALIVTVSGRQCDGMVVVPVVSNQICIRPLRWDRTRQRHETMRRKRKAPNAR